MLTIGLSPEEMIRRRRLAERIVSEGSMWADAAAQIASLRLTAAPSLPMAAELAGLLEEEAPPAIARGKAGPRGLPVIDWEGHGLADLAPRLLPFPKPPPGRDGGWEDHDPLPRADVVVMTWTVDEWAALHYVFSNELSPLPNDRGNQTWREAWYPYRRDFYAVFQTLWVRRLINAERDRLPGAPALLSNQMRWGSFCLVRVAGKTVLLIKSELHINQDGEGLPLRRFVRQVLEEAQPGLILSIGTSGGVRLEDGLGDTVVTNAARFRLGDEFRSASFNDRLFRSGWTPPTGLLDRAHELLVRVDEFPVEPPTAHYSDRTRIDAIPHDPEIKIVDLPILTTDFFEFGTTENRLGAIGCCVEMDDAVIAMVADELGVPYGFLRNISDPVINAELPRELQEAWAVTTYYRCGLRTSFNGAIATWAMIAGSGS